MLAGAQNTYGMPESRALTQDFLRGLAELVVGALLGGVAPEGREHDLAHVRGVVGAGAQDLAARDRRVRPQLIQPSAAGEIAGAQLPQSLERRIPALAGG